MLINHIKSITEKGIEYIKEKYDWTEVNGANSVKVELVKSNLWKHYITFDGKDFPTKISIVKRKEVDNYTKELTEILKDNFSIKQH